MNFHRLDRQCANCNAYEPPQDRQRARCHGRPPLVVFSAVAQAGLGAPETIYHTRWPEVDEQEWCREWIQKAQDDDAGGV